MAKPHIKGPIATLGDAPGRTTDSFVNFKARLGLGQNNLLSASSYAPTLISRNRQLLEWSYRGSWIVGAAVDTVAEDMTRAGVEIKSDLPPDDEAELHHQMQRLCLWQALCDTIRWSRLYGGAIAVLLIDGQRLDKSLNVKTVGKDQFKGLTVLDRWMVNPSLSETITEYGPDLGMPVWYDVLADSPSLPRTRIHYSRVIRFDGVPLPYFQRATENGWGMSVLERLYDRLVAFDSATTGASQLTFKAHLRTYKVEGLRSLVAAGGRAMQALIEQMEMIRQYQSSEGLTLLDGKDEFQAHTYNFAGLSDIILQIGQQLSGALQVPLVRLFGQSPAGLNSTGESDIRTYYDGIAQRQEAQMRRPMTRLLEVLFYSTFGKAPPDNWGFRFAPLWQMSATEKADIASKVTDTVVKANDAGVIGRATALKELRQSSETSGVWTNITDEDIEEAEAEPPPGQEALLPQEPAEQPPEEGAPPAPEFEGESGQSKEGRGGETTKVPSAAPKIKLH